MNKPEKKEETNWADCNLQIKGYNQAIDDFKKFLPSEDEIIDLLLNASKKFNIDKESTAGISLPTYLAKAIAKRIGK